MVFEAANVTNPVELFTYANTVTSGVFWPLMLAAIFIVTYMGLSSKAGSQKAFAASGFLTGIIGSFMFVLGFIEVLPALIAIVLAIAAFVMLLFSKE